MHYLNHLLKRPYTYLPLPLDHQAAKVCIHDEEDVNRTIHTQLANTLLMQQPSTCMYEFQLLGKVDVTLPIWLHIASPLHNL